MPDLISDCCYEDYKDKKRENQERLQEERVENADISTLKLSLKEKMWAAFENPHTTSIALVFYYVIGFFIAVSVMCNIVETIPCGYEDNVSVTCGEAYEEQFFVIDTACVIIFTIEYFLRLISAPDRIKFMRYVSFNINM